VQESGGHAKAHEPVKLHVFMPPDIQQHTRFYLGLGKSTIRNKFNPGEPSAKLDFSAFQFILAQIPAVQTIEFSGWGEPLDNPDIFKMIQHATQSRNIDCQIFSHGHFDNRVFQQLFTCGVSKLTISMVAHKPSAFSAMTNRNPAEFLALEKTIEQLVLVRQHYPDSQVFIELSMVVDLITLSHIPDMIAYAERLGVDAIRFENHLGSNPDERCLQTLMTGYKKAERFLQELSFQSYNLQVTLPTLLDPDMENHRHCSDPHTTVSIDENLYISPCSRHLVFNELTHSVWDQDFWNNDQYQWLRSRHSASGEAVPKPCQFCPKNVKHTGKVLYSTTPLTPNAVPATNNPHEPQRANRRFS